MFEFYRAVFGGVKITDEVSFERILLYAKAYIERIKNPQYACDYAEDSVKTGLCALCDALFEQLELQHIEREEWDGFAKNYATADWYGELYKTAQLFFPPEALYRGCGA